MKEIDFLPAWHKSNRRRQIGYRAQYVALVGIFVVMMVWNYTTGRSIARAKAELAEMSARQSEAESVSVSVAEIKGNIVRLQSKNQSLKDIDSRIDVASVLAELSFLTDEKLVLREVEFSAEGLACDTAEAKDRCGKGAKGVEFEAEPATLLGGVRFRVMIKGMAADVTDVARFMCRLEESPYFGRVVPCFMQDTKLQVRPPGTDLKASEFEITCYLANYRWL